MAELFKMPRMLPIAILSRIDLPDWFMQWLKYIPAAILAALLVPEIFMADNIPDFSLGNKKLIAAIPCIFAACKTKNLFITVSTGIASMLLLNLIFT